MRICVFERRNKSIKALLEYISRREDQRNIVDMLIETPRCLE